jgi:hypothetical protein
MSYGPVVAQNYGGGENHYCALGQHHLDYLEEFAPIAACVGLDLQAFCAVEAYFASS